MPASIVAYTNNKLLVVDSNGNYKQLLPETQPGNIIGLTDWIRSNASSIIIGTASEFTTNATAVIPAGVLAIETDTGKMKIGDGSTQWSSLGYATIAATKLSTSRQIDGISFDGTSNITRYATCSTAAATANKEVTVTGFNLVTGARIYVKFANTNSADNPTLQVNSETAKAIVGADGNAITGATLVAGNIFCFMYNGTNFEIVGGVGGSGGSVSADTMTLQQAIAGTSTTGMAISPKVLSDALNTMMAPVYMTKSEWYTNAPVVRGGIIAVESDTGRCKIGDGVSTYNMLPYTSMTIAVNEADELLLGYIIHIDPDGEDNTYVNATEAGIELKIKNNQGNYVDPN